MKQLLITAVLGSVLSCALLPNPVEAARRRPNPAPKTYQVTGPVLELTNELIVVQKGKDRWEIARDSGSKVTGDLKVGANVTIQYRMTATSVAVQAAKAGPAKGKAAPKKP
jgi:hypothetical protein